MKAVRSCKPSKSIIDPTPYRTAQAGAQSVESVKFMDITISTILQVQHLHVGNSLIETALIPLVKREKTSIY